MSTVMTQPEHEIEEGQELHLEIDDEPDFQPIEEIQAEIKKIDGMLNKVDSRIKRYHKQIAIESGISDDTLDLIKKGLEILELNKQQDYES